MCNHINPIHCIVPPHMVEKLANSEDPEVRQIAVKTLQMDIHYRSERLEMARINSLFPTLTDNALAGHTAVKHREVYSAGNSDQLPAVLVRGEGDAATGDGAIDEAYDRAGETWDFYNEVHGRNSIDDQGMRMKSTVHYDRDYANAFWNGTQMVYGDGDGRVFNRLTASLDVIAHELTHGVVEHEGGLQYRYQSGALNESFADVFGSLVKQRMLG